MQWIPTRTLAGWFKPGIDRWDRPMASVAVDGPDRIFMTTAPVRFTRPNAPMLTADGKVMEERSQASTIPADKHAHDNIILVLNGEGEYSEVFVDALSRRIVRVRER